MLDQKKLIAIQYNSIKNNIFSERFLNKAKFLIIEKLRNKDFREIEEDILAEENWLNYAPIWDKIGKDVLIWAIVNSNNSKPLKFLTSHKDLLLLSNLLDKNTYILDCFLMCLIGEKQFSKHYHEESRTKDIIEKILLLLTINPKVVSELILNNKHFESLSINNDSFIQMIENMTPRNRQCPQKLN